VCDNPLNSKLTKNLIYIFDDTSDPKQCVSALRGIKSARVFLCPLTLSYRKILGVQEELSCITNCHTETISFVDYYHKKTFELKDEYIRFIAEFADKRFISGKSIKEFYRYPFKDFSLWWSSLVAEKNTLKTDSYQRFVKLKTLLDLAALHRCDEVWIDLEDTGLTECLIMSSIKTQNLRDVQTNGDLVPFFKSMIAAVVKLVSFTYKMLLFRTALGSLKKRTTSLMRAKYILVTYFPLVDRKLFSRHIFMDKYYGPLQRSIEKHYRGDFVWLAMMNRLDNLSWRQSVTMGRQINEWGHTLFFIEEWLRLRDLLEGLVVYMWVATRFIRKVPKIKRAFRFSAGKMEIWPLFKTDWYQSFCGKTLVESILYYRAFSNFLKYARKHATVLYMFEMHAWEKALNVSARERQNVKTIGIQHSIVPLLLLNYFPHSSEISNGDYIATMPKPDYLACVGKIPVRLFLKVGWDKKHVFSLGAIRFQYIRGLLGDVVPWDKRKDKIVVALSYSADESKEILKYILEAFRTGANYKVLIKGHPASPVEPILKDLNCTLDHNVFKVVSTPLDKLLSTAKAVIVNESTAALEAIACHCPVIIPRLMTTLDMNPLSGLSDLPIYVNSPQEMKRVVDQIVESKGGAHNFERCQTFIRSYFEFLDSDDAFLGRIERFSEIGA